MNRRLKFALAGVVSIALIVALSACRAVPGNEREVTVVIKDLRFNPETITIAEGTKVTWINKDSTAHTSTSADFSAEATSNPPGSWNSPVLDPDESWSRTFDAAGTYDYGCSIHPYIKGTVQVTSK